jgi:hypothetical protein
MALWAIYAVHPGKHPTGEILYVCETRRFEDHAGLAAAVATAAITDDFDFGIFPAVDIIRFHISDPAEREKGAADIEFGVLAWFADVQQVEGFTGVEPGFEFFDRNSLHIQNRFLVC